MMDFEALITYLAGAGVVGLIAWVVRLQSRQHDAEIRHLKFQNDVATHYVTKVDASLSQQERSKTETKLFDALEALKDELHALREEVRVALSRRDD